MSWDPPQKNFNAAIRNASRAHYLLPAVVVLRNTNLGPTQPLGVQPQFFFGVNILPYTYKLFCYTTFGPKATA